MTGSRPLSRSTRPGERCCISTRGRVRSAPSSEGADAVVARAPLRQRRPSRLAHLKRPRPRRPVRAAAAATRRHRLASSHSRVPRPASTAWRPPSRATDGTSPGSCGPAQSNAGGEQRLLVASTDALGVSDRAPERNRAPRRAIAVAGRIADRVPGHVERRLGDRRDRARRQGRDARDARDSARSAAAVSRQRSPGRHDRRGPAPAFVSLRADTGRRGQPAYLPADPALPQQHRPHDCARVQLGRRRRRLEAARGRRTRRRYRLARTRRLPDGPVGAGLGC